MRFLRFFVTVSITVCMFASCEKNEYYETPLLQKSLVDNEGLLREATISGKRIETDPENHIIVCDQNYEGVCVKIYYLVPWLKSTRGCTDNVIISAKKLKNINAIEIATDEVSIDTLGSKIIIGWE